MKENARKVQGSGEDLRLGPHQPLGVRVAGQGPSQTTLIVLEMGLGNGRDRWISFPAGALSPEKAVAPLAGPPRPPGACGPGHVHPHVTHQDQLP